MTTVRTEQPNLAEELLVLSAIDELFPRSTKHQNTIQDILIKLRNPQLTGFNASNMINDLCDTLKADARYHGKNNLDKPLFLIDLIGTNLKKIKQIHDKNRKKKRHEDEVNKSVFLKFLYGKKEYGAFLTFLFVKKEDLNSLAPKKTYVNEDVFDGSVSVVKMGTAVIKIIRTAGKAGAVAFKETTSAFSGTSDIWSFIKVAGDKTKFARNASIIAAVIRIMRSFIDITLFSLKVATRLSSALLLIAGSTATLARDVYSNRLNDKDIERQRRMVRHEERKLYIMTHELGITNPQLIAHQQAIIDKQKADVEKSCSYSAKNRYRIGLGTIAITCAIITLTLATLAVGGLASGGLLFPMILGITFAVTSLLKAADNLLNNRISNYLFGKKAEPSPKVQLGQAKSPGTYHQLLSSPLKLTLSSPDKNRPNQPSTPTSAKLNQLSKRQDKNIKIATQSFLNKPKVTTNETTPYRGTRRLSSP